jgi:hypothetical protein
VVYLANVAAKRIGEGVVRGPVEVLAGATSLALGLTESTWEDLLSRCPPRSKRRSRNTKD